MPSLPMELVVEILTLSMISETPMDLTHYLEKICEGWVEDPDNITELVSIIDFLHKSQHEHHKDWIVANSVCHAWRRIGKKAFFQQKTLIVEPTLITDLATEHAIYTPGLLEPLGSALRKIITTETRHIIVPMKIFPDLADIACLKSLKSYCGLCAIDIFIYPDLYQRYDASALEYPEKYELDQSMKEHLFLVGDWRSGLKINYVMPTGKLNEWRIEEWENAVKELQTA